MTPSTPPSYAGHRFPPEVISHAVWLYFRFPLGLRMVEEMLAARGITVSHETVRQWALKFGQGFANEIRRRLPRPGDKWHLDEVQIKIAGKKHWRHRQVKLEGDGEARKLARAANLCGGFGASDLGPHREGLRADGSVLNGRKVIAVEVEEVVDLAVRREEPLRLAG